MSNDNEPDIEEVETTTLPLSEREENPPLVVDLPDGQKLVVGDIKAGTVIEVATWRGTGRPDSRTHRFMLGISHDEPEVTIPRSPNPEPIAPKPIAPEVVLSEAVIPEPQFVSPEMVEVDEEILEEALEKSAPEATVTEASATEKAFMRSESLTSRMDLLFGPRTNFDDSQPASGVPKQSNRELVAPLKGPKVKRKFKVRTPAIFSVFTILIVALFFWSQNISIAHPKSGLSTALGEAKSTLMILQSKDEYSVGESIVGDSNQPSGNPVFGVVAAEGDGVYMLNGNIGFVSINEDKVRGKVVAIAPWWGKLVSLFDK